MRKFDRLPAPQIIIDNWEEIGKQYEAKRLLQPNYKFTWPQIKNQKLNQVALPVLMEQTARHCSYCDKYPPLKGDYTIDHFKPKTNPLYYTLVSHWENLYFACKHCQDSKGIKFDELLLQPDEVDFSFSKYFTYNFTEHKIEPNPAASDEDQLRAIKSIEIFDLNFPGVKTSRRHALQKFNGDLAPDLDDYNYRFMFDF